ncbi:hypothetical protein [Candidatus Uabimicrobium sp. HlEnr_7]|uniref:hypothetical protein n=1 Tax=Candidatus Uabimicrobium helgolandensis TaxID=3095367 RepID=UPI0035570885
MVTKFRIGYPYASVDPEEEREAVVVLYPHRYSGFDTVIKEQRECKLVATDLGPRILSKLSSRGVVGNLIEAQDERDSIVQQDRVIGQGTSMQLALILAVFAKYQTQSSDLPLLLFSAAINNPKGAPPFIDAKIETYCLPEEVLVCLISKYKSAQMAKAQALVLPKRDARILAAALGKKSYGIDQLKKIKTKNIPLIVEVESDALPQLAKIIGVSPYHYHDRKSLKNIFIKAFIILFIILCSYFFSILYSYPNQSPNLCDVRLQLFTSFPNKKLLRPDICNLNGENVITTQYFAPGKYQLILTHHGYKSISKIITIPKKKKYTIHYILQAKQIEIGLRISHSIVLPQSQQDFVFVSLKNLQTQESIPVTKKLRVFPGEYLLEAQTRSLGFRNLKYKITIPATEHLFVIPLHFTSVYPNGKTQHIIYRLIEELDIMAVPSAIKKQTADPILITKVKTWINNIGGAKEIELDVLTAGCKHIDWRVKLVTIYIAFIISQEKPEVATIINKAISKDALFRRFVTNDIQKQLFITQALLEDKPLVDVLLNVFNHGNFEQKSIAIGKLAKLKVSASKMPSIVTSVQQMLTDNSHLFSKAPHHDNLVDFFQKHGPKLQQLIPTLLEEINKDNGSKFAYECLFFIGSDAVSKIIDFSKRNPQITGLNNVLSMIDIKDLSVVTDLLFCLRQDEYSASQKIATIGKKAIPYLVKALRHRNHKTSQIASSIIAEDKEYANAAVPVVINLLSKHVQSLRQKITHANYSTVVMWIKILAKAQQNTPQVIPILLQLISFDPRYQKEVIVALGKIDKEAQSITTLIKSIHKDYSQNALLEIGQTAILPLYKSLQDPFNKNYRQYMAYVLKKMEPRILAQSNFLDIKQNNELSIHINHALFLSNENKTLGRRNLSRIAINKNLSPKIRIEALECLPKAEIPEFEICLDDNNILIQLKVIEIYDKLDSLSESTTKKIKHFLGSSSKILRSAAAITLFSQSPENPKYLKHVLQELDDLELEPNDHRYIKVKKYIVMRVTRKKRLALFLLPTITKVINHNYNAKESIVDILKNIESHDIDLGETLLKLLSIFINENKISKAIEKAILKLGLKIVPSLLKELIKKQRKPYYYDFRLLKMLDTLEYQRPKKFAYIFNQLQQSSKWQVRIMARKQNNITDK